ncbi:unnamed protein product, partial [Prorocentrum cordatum]
MRSTYQSDGNIDGTDADQGDGNAGAERIGESDGNRYRPRLFSWAWISTAAAACACSSPGAGAPESAGSPVDAILSSSNDTPTTSSLSEQLHPGGEVLALRSSGGGGGGAREGGDHRCLRQMPAQGGPKTPMGTSARPCAGESFPGTDIDECSNHPSEERMFVLRSARADHPGVQLPRGPASEGGSGVGAEPGSGIALAASDQPGYLAGDRGRTKVPGGGARRLRPPGSGREKEAIKQLDEQDLNILFEGHDKASDAIYRGIAEDVSELNRPFRVDLAEVRCPGCPSLTRAVQGQGGNIYRCGYFNGIDMATAMREQMRDTVMHGCVHALREDRSGLLMKKAWRIFFADLESGATLGGACSDRPGRGDSRPRRAIEDGQVVAQIACYLPAPCKAWAKHIIRKGASAHCGAEIYSGLGQATLEGGLPPDELEEMGEDEVMRGLGIFGAPTKKEEVEIEQRLARSFDSLYVFNVMGVLEVLASDELEWPSPKQDIFTMALNLDWGPRLTSATYRGEKGERSGNRSTSEELIHWAVAAANSMDKVGNPSPFEHVVGVT